MTALSSPRLVPTKGDSTGPIRSLPMAAVKIWSGALVMLNSSGYATNGAASAGNEALTVAGLAEETVDNSGGSAGDLYIRVKACNDSTAFGFVNDGTDACTIAHVGEMAYLVDNQTVANAQTGGTATKPLVGNIHSIDSDDSLVYVTVPGRYLG
jgi:hypothetical protein